MKHPRLSAGDGWYMFNVYFPMLYDFQISLTVKGLYNENGKTIKDKNAKNDNNTKKIKKEEVVWYKNKGCILNSGSRVLQTVRRRKSQPIAHTTAIPTTAPAKSSHTSCS